MRAPRSAVIGVLVVLLGISTVGRDSPPDPAPRAPDDRRGRGRLAASRRPARRGGRDRRHVRVRRVRRDHERGPSPAGPGGSRDRLRERLRGHAHPEGEPGPGRSSSNPGRHVLVANALGLHAAAADATYSGGLAATGGAIVLRRVGGEVVDAVGWGDATNAFVEGGAAPAPPAGSSIERRPGGPDGNITDTNDNAADWVVRAQPVPQPLAAAPGPGPTPTPTPTPAPSARRPRPSRDPDRRRPTPPRPRRPRPRPRRRPPHAHAHALADPDPDARRPRPRPTPTPDARRPTPIAHAHAHADPDTRRPAPGRPSRSRQHAPPPTAPGSWSRACSRCRSAVSRTAGADSSRTPRRESRSSCRPTRSTCLPPARSSAPPGPSTTGTANGRSVSTARSSTTGCDHPALRPADRDRSGSRGPRGRARRGRRRRRRHADVPGDRDLPRDRRRVGLAARHPRVCRRVRPVAGRRRAGGGAPRPARHHRHGERRLPGPGHGPGGDRDRPGRPDTHAGTHADTRSHRLRHRPTRAEPPAPTELARAAALAASRPPPRRRRRSRSPPRGRAGAMPA